MSSSTQATVTLISQNVIQVATVGIAGPPGPPGPAAPVLQAQIYFQSAATLTFPFNSSAQYAYTITGLYGLKCASGAINVTVAINGTPVTGLNNVAVTQTAQNPVAVANNAVAVGARVTVSFSGGGIASNLECTLGASLTNT